MSLRAGGHAVVVGASSVLGTAIARSLQNRGLSITGLSRSPPRGAPYRAGIRCDAGSPADLDDALAEAEAYRPIDVLVYAAGAPCMGATLSIPDTAARESLEVNFWGLERSVRRVLPGMVAREHGAILAVLSLAAVRAVPHEAYYAAGKAAAARFLECLQHEVRASGVRVHYVAPGFIDTGFFARGGWFGMRPPAVRGSGVSPEDVATAAVDLLASEAVGRVVGWRERVITLSDRLAPGLYDRVLRRRGSRHG